jgi:hypothetical protein
MGWMGWGVARFARDGWRVVVQPSCASCDREDEMGSTSDAGRGVTGVEIRSSGDEESIALARRVLFPGGQRMDCDG